jgi:hypothetical protein
MAVWTPTREELQLLNEYHHALNIYYGAVFNWLNRFDTHADAEEHQRLTNEKDKADRASTNLRAALDKLRADHS